MIRHTSTADLSKARSPHATRHASPRSHAVLDGGDALEKRSSPAAASCRRSPPPLSRTTWSGAAKVTDKYHSLSCNAAQSVGATRHLSRH